MPAFGRILCPLDFSDASMRAYQYADALARWLQAPLTIQHVYAPIFVPVPGLPPPGERVPAGEIERLTAELRAVAARSDRDGLPTDVVVDIGNVGDQIVARAARDQAGLIVVGTHGASGFTHLVLGSVAEKVLRRAGCPVLTVPPGARAASPDLRFRRILCAVDFSEWSTAALAVATSLAELSGAVLLAVHVVEWPWHETPDGAYPDLPAKEAAALIEFRRYITDRSARRLEQAVAEVVAGRCETTTEVVHGKAHEALTRLSGEHDVDLVVLGVHGRSAVDMAVFGSTANQVVRHAACPVLTVRR